jgi:hypothetical protein
MTVYSIAYGDVPNLVFHKAVNNRSYEEVILMTHKQQVTKVSLERNFSYNGQELLCSNSIPWKRSWGQQQLPATTSMF